MSSSTESSAIFVTDTPKKVGLSSQHGHPSIALRGSLRTAAFVRRLLVFRPRLFRDAVAACLGVGSRQRYTLATPRVVFAKGGNIPAWRTSWVLRSVSVAESSPSFTAM